MANDTPSDDPVAPWRAMLVAHNRVVRAIEAELRSVNTIPLTWYDVLLELRAAAGPLRMQDLADRVVLSRTRVSRLVDELETAGLLTRRADPDDRRATLAEITATGREALRATAPHYLRGIESHFTQHLTEAERRSITRGLTRVADAHPSGNERLEKGSARQRARVADRPRRG